MNLCPSAKDAKEREGKKGTSRFFAFFVETVFQLKKSSCMS